MFSSSFKEITLAFFFLHINAMHLLYDSIPLLFTLSS